MPKSEVKVFVSKDAQLTLTDEDKELIKKFRHYKITGDHQCLFGRDVPYERPPSAVLADLHHVHIIELPERYNKRNTQFQNRTNAKHLVYTRGFTNKNHYYVLCVLTRPAHEKATKQFIAKAIVQSEHFRKYH